MNVFATLSRIVEHWAFRVFVFLLVISAASIYALHVTIDGMAHDQFAYKITAEPSSIIRDYLVSIIFEFVFLLPCIVYKIFKKEKLNNFVLTILLFLNLLFARQITRLDFTPSFDYYDYSFVGKHWPVIREIAFQNAVIETLYGAVLCVVILRLIDTGRRFYTLLIAEADARR